jgi:hypothetical protein
MLQSYLRKIPTSIEILIVTGSTQRNNGRPVRPTFERKCCVSERNKYFPY